MRLPIYQAAALTSVMLFMSGCDDAKRHERMVRELIEVDREFSRQSVEKGAHESFLMYIDDSCVLLRPNREPVIGRKKIEEIYSKPDTSFSLTWEPLDADISKSEDLGYTYGTYTVQMDSPEGTSVTKEGTYVTIWKKDKNGDWKFVLDTGNQGLGNKNGDK
jgi:ketosteroid isomerase-like protein